MTFEATYEISKGEETFTGSQLIEAQSQERAREYAEHVLEEMYPGDEGYVLLSLEIE